MAKTIIVLNRAHIGTYSELGITEEVAEQTRRDTKKCECCSEYKEFDEFIQDKTIKSGIKNICKECRARNERERQKKRKQKAQRIYKRPLSGEEFIALWSDQGLRQWIKQQCAMKTYDEDLRLDLFQVAWIDLSMTIPGLSKKRLKEIAYQAIHREYMKIWRSRKKDMEYMEMMDVDSYISWTKGYRE